MSALANPTPTLVPRRRALAQNIESATNSPRGFRYSPAFQRAVRDAAAYYFARDQEAEISAQVRERLRRDWPGITEADVDYALTGMLLARDSAAATLEEAARNGLGLAADAERAVWSEARDGFGKPMASERRRTRRTEEEGAA